MINNGNFIGYDKLGQKRSFRQGKHSLSIAIHGL